ncbi:ANTAR domain-containing protein [Spirillospora sp. NPDC050679]
MSTDDSTHDPMTATSPATDPAGGPDVAAEAGGPGARPIPREGRVLAALVDLADTLVANFDLVDLLHRVTRHCVELLEVDGAGVMYAAPDRALRLMASSTEQVRVLELFELNADTGPCLTAYRTGQVTHYIDPGPGDPSWEPVITRAGQAGFSTLYAVPLRLRENTIGVLNLFGRIPRPLAGPDQDLARALADIATIALLQQRNLDQQTILNRQLQIALDSRIHIEQAKGIIASRQGITTDAAFQVLRTHARATNQKLADLARAIAVSTPHPPQRSPGSSPPPRS